ncbi:MAG: NADH-quinone oxidoreductase subunit N, partial [Deltaproteobacteria bacterium]|nr:NADH-quinone oxidoreductase subunit N [Candidatus Anaeroferrophillacea bacterium]
MNLDLFIPEIILAATAILVIVLDLFVRSSAVVRYTSIAGLAAAAGVAIAMWDGGGSAFGGMLAADNFALFFKVFLAGTAIIVILASADYAEKFSRFKGEYYALILLSTLGMTLMAATTSLIAIYVSLELASLALYVLAGFLRDRASAEASLKYLLLGAAASAILLYGSALVFGVTGTMDLGGIATAIGTLSLAGVADNPALLAGIVLLIAGFGFKVAAVPFHLWVPDVYEGAPTTVSAYLSVASKAAGFAVLLRIFATAFGTPGWLSETWGLIFAILAAAGMIAGNTGAIPQTNIKRMLGYSGIAQAGYLLVGLATLGYASSLATTGQSGVLFFLSAYALSNLGAFTAIIIISKGVGSDLIADYAGLGRRSPLLALALTLCLISLTGIPPAVGFMGKFYIFSHAASNGLL